MTRATLDLAVRCIEYLCQRHHDPEISGEECSNNVCTGQYVLHAFSTRMWFDLVCQYFRLIKGANPSDTLADSIARLYECRKAQDFSIDSENGNTSEDESGNEADPRTRTPDKLLLNQLLWSVSKFRNSSLTLAENSNQSMSEC